MAQGVISLDHVDGESVPGQIVAGPTITFYLRLQNGTVYDLLGSTNGFRFYSPDGGIWSPLVGDTANIGWGEIYDGGVYISPLSVTGSGSDTIGFGGFAMVKPGIQTGFDQIVLTISTSIDPSQNGKTFCLDSSYYAPAGYWLWSHSSNGTSLPGWDGPHCYVATGCCVGIRGNVNNDAADEIDISDMVYLVDYMFTSGTAPECWGEANIDGSGPVSGGTDSADDIDISDLVFLVDYMFTSGPPPVDCF